MWAPEATVVDDVVCTEGTSDVHIPCATHSRHFRSQRFGNLHGKGADAARCAIDEDFVPRLDPAFVAQTLQGGDACQRHRRRLLERQVGWFRTGSGLRQRRRIRRRRCGLPWFCWRLLPFEEKEPMAASNSAFQHRYQPEMRERAVRMVREAIAESGERVGAVTRVARQLGIGPESLRNWVKQAEIDSGKRPGVTTAEQRRINELERENRELKRANEILKAAASFFARELDPRLPK